MMKTITVGRHAPERIFESYRAAIPFIADWAILAGVAERVVYDRRLREEERDSLLAAITARELVVRPNCPNITPS